MNTQQAQIQDDFDYSVLEEAELLFALAEEGPSPQEVFTTTMAEELILAHETKLDFDVIENVPVKEIQAVEQNAAQPEEAQIADNNEEIDNRNFIDLMRAVTVENAENTRYLLQAALSTRAQYELDMNPGNANIQKTLSKIAKDDQRPSMALAMAASGVSPHYYNACEGGKRRRNVYAIQKAQDLLMSAAKGSINNSVNRAICKSMFELEKLGQCMTMEIAKACASDKVPTTNDLKAVLTRHSVSAATAPTQAGSTMMALLDLGVVKNTGTPKSPVYTIQNTPLAHTLRVASS